MNQKELKELIEFLIDKDISEFELERGDVKVRIKRGADQQVAPIIQHIPVSAHPAPVAHSAPVAATSTPLPAHPPATSSAPPPAATDEGLHIVKSPIVGTYYESPSPGSPPFVKPGDTVEAGQVLCIIEAMKLMNEIESDMAGEIVKRLVKDRKSVV